MNRALETWKDLPGLPEGVSSPNGKGKLISILFLQFLLIFGLNSQLKKF